MKAKDLKVGDSVSTGNVREVLSSPQPDRIIIKIWDDETQQVRFLNLFKDSEVNPDKVYIDRGAILNEFMENLKNRLEYGARTHGEFWQGNDPSKDIEEELLDALVYLWIQRKMSKPQPVREPFSYKIGDQVQVKAGIVNSQGVIIGYQERNSQGQSCYVVRLREGTSYIAIRSELSIIPRTKEVADTFSGIIDTEVPFDFGGDT